ncbi:restriction endonuclease subunit S [Cycloclasticus sp. P1]|uniref:restriction endonuclease subunit S n=1 Tax=Cycloclasticus sp. (strain P1) TaxID=385025 RepID=UPI000286AAED|nr:restriction endonuclease subunit S [Cycloclasticus sp. P1]AFT66255.1 Restriction modification system DNA specificity domain protein [Cycloclasticus sp. P1]
MSWGNVAIEDIAQVKGGKRLPKGHDFISHPTPYPYIRARDIGGGKIELKEHVYLSEETHNQIKRYIVNKDDVVITIVGANVGDAGYVQENLDGANLTENAAKLVVDKSKFNPYFLKLYLSTERCKKRLAFIASGAAQGKLGLYKIKTFPVSNPPLDVQKKIVDIVQSYDDLIENNKRRIELLEESARQLYKEWFVRFRFPGHEHVKIIDGVPEGWEKKTISEISSFLSRGMTPKYDDEGKYIVINQKCIRNRALSLDLIRRQSKDFKKEKLVQNGDVLINSTGTGTLGRVAQCWIDIKDCTVDTHVTIVRPNADICSYWFGYCLMELETIFEGMGEGATNQKELKRDLVGALNVLSPASSLQSEFQDIISSNIKQISNLVEQNKNLIRARDLLLPRLMNGEIKV